MTTRSDDAVHRACRRVGLDRNPLRRLEDRCQTCAGALVMLAVLLAVPLAILFVGRPVYAGELAQVRAETSRLHRVQATVTEVGRTPLYAPITPVKVRWTSADGTVRTGEHHSDVMVKPGATVPIWLDSRERIVAPPAETRPLSRAVLAGSGVVAGTLIVCVAGYLALRLGLDRRRAKRWELEWATLGTGWGGQGAS
ncbi:Rv1733c family protein [Nocardia takedensis]